MKTRTYKFPIPGRLNLLIAGVQVALLVFLLWSAGQVFSWLWLLVLAPAFGVVGISAVLLAHEAEHNILHPNRRVNDIVGALLLLFLPAPFHLIRQGHIWHHVHNRTDDDAFDFFYEGENSFWTRLQLYGRLTGLFWPVVCFSNVMGLFAPWTLNPKKNAPNTGGSGFRGSLKPKYQRAIQIECVGVFALHGTMLWAFDTSLVRYGILYLALGFIYSTVQYLFHYGTERHIYKGALNIHAGPVMNAITFNHSFHLNHHMHPNVPWVYLPFVDTGRPFFSGSVLSAYLRMWNGPKPAKQHYRTGEGGANHHPDNA